MQSCGLPVPNPWADLPLHPPFVLAADSASIERSNRTATERYRIRLECLPEPFIGSPEGRLVLLNLTPGFSEADPEVHAREEVRSLIRSNLVHETNAFYYFGPAFDGTPGGVWWRRRLNPLVEAVGQGAVAAGTLVVELFAYHSVGWKSCRVPSQLYGAELVRQALHRDAVVVAMRALRHWRELVPELGVHAQLFTLNSAQNVTVSRRNCPSGWVSIVNALR